MGQHSHRLQTPSPRRIRSDALVPSTTTAVVIFLLLVTPGIGFELLWQRTHPRRDESTFVEISRVLLAGVVLSGISAALLALLGAATTGVVIDPRALVGEGQHYIEAHLSVLVCDVASLLLLGFLLGTAANDLFTRTGANRIAQETVWHTAFSRIAPPGTHLFVSVQLKDDTVITGYEAGYSLEPDPAKRELVLAAPLTIRRTGTTNADPLDAAWQRILLPGAEIRSVAVAYVGQPAPTLSLGKHQRVIRWIARHTWQTSLTAAAALLTALLLASLITGKGGFK